MEEKALTLLIFITLLFACYWKRQDPTQLQSYLSYAMLIRVCWNFLLGSLFLLTFSPSKLMPTSNSPSSSTFSTSSSSSLKSTSTSTLASSEHDNGVPTAPQKFTFTLSLRKALQTPNSRLQRALYGAKQALHLCLLLPCLFLLVSLFLATQKVTGGRSSKQNLNLQVLLPVDFTASSLLATFTGATAVFGVGLYVRGLVSKASVAPIDELLQKLVSNLASSQGKSKAKPLSLRYRAVHTTLALIWLPIFLHFLGAPQPLLTLSYLTLLSDLSLFLILPVKNLTMASRKQKNKAARLSKKVKQNQKAINRKIGTSQQRKSTAGVEFRRRAGKGSNDRADFEQEHLDRIGSDDDKFESHIESDCSDTVTANSDVDENVLEGAAEELLHRKLVRALLRRMRRSLSWVEVDDGNDPKNGPRDAGYTAGDVDASADHDSHSDPDGNDGGDVDDSASISGINIHKYDKLFFLLNWLKSPLTTGAVFPSSKYLANEIISEIDIEERNKNIVELGPGTGSFTQLIIRKKHDSSEYHAFELNEEFNSKLQQKFGDFRDNFHCASAEEMYTVLSKRAHKVVREKVDIVISGLPFSVFPSELQESILRQVKLVLKKQNGVFVTFAYAIGMFLPRAQGFKKLLRKFFRKVTRSRIVWRNLPPAFVYRCET